MNSLSFENDFANNDLARDILKNAGVLSIQTNSFPNIPLKGYGEFYSQGTVNISIV